MGWPGWQDESDSSGLDERMVGAIFSRSERLDVGFFALKDAKHRLDNSKDARRVRRLTWYVYGMCEG